MKKRKFGLALSLVLAAGTLLGACGSSETNEGSTGSTDSTEEKFKVAMVTDVGGVDDKSFNQSAWEGIKAYGADNGLEEGNEGYSYLQSQSDADYETNLNTLARQDFNLVYGIGFLMMDAVNNVASQQTETQFGIVDAVVEQPNVASITFKENEAGYLAGVAAGLATKTNKVGFIGGMEIEVIDRFEAGFIAGVKAVNPDAEVDSQYAGAFDKAELGQTIAASMYSSNVDVIFHAAGATGNGLFKEARDLKAKDPSRYIWAIGVDADQTAEGVLEIDGEEKNIILTSALKRVDVAVKDLAEQAKAGTFPGGEVINYGLAEDGVGLAPVNPDVENVDDINSKVEEYKEQIKNGEIEVPASVSEL
ncbi:CD4+ T-cell-stimulating antigen [Bacillus coahuilensis p1.1.43]|uniref:CD4+ T-cell-stimulating antigen n=1 Tax=Bacillus coahuilensis p1.1.43 TaxID=1150625 RepID=A0A147K9Q6_9BACI|nr:BMP family protein [Bacillus coahuilensis]KUP07175.1 CD4+ T-cell-stimulating antigen [Bacillus coahuilensis p1.1.43]